jgi:hypothetical protein
MHDFNYSHDMLQTHINDLHREAAERRLAKLALSGQPSRLHRLTEAAGRRLIQLGWRIAAPKTGTLVVDKTSTHELRVVDAKLG